ncbi:MAG: LysR family transcriptional regulator [Burkholderiaceae bacterium]
MHRPNRNGLNTRQIEVFKAVYECGSMTAAATMLGVSQPAITALVRQLEDRIGFALFDRSGRRLRPTVEGDLFYEDVDRALTGIAMLAERANDIRERRRGRLVIGAMPALSMGFVQSVIAELTQGPDAISIALMTRHSPMLLSLVALNQLDVAMVAYLGPSPQVHVQSVHPIPLVCVLPPGHRLARQDRVQIADLAGEDLIGLSSLDRLGPRVQELLASHHVAVRNPISTELTMAACGFVLQGLGVALTDPFSAGLFGHAGVQIRPFDPQIMVEIAIVRSMDLKPGVDTLAAHFIAATERSLRAMQS